MRRIERQAMERSITDFDGRSVFVQKMDVWPQVSMSIVIQKRVVVAPDQYRRHPSFCGARQLSYQESTGLKIRVTIVKNVTRKHKRIDLFRYRQINDLDKGITAGLLQAISEVGIAQCYRSYG
ncbi:hypothetical protein TL5118_00511 [Thalassovita autumnalis]|uniref:PemK-like protein n=1 Tax=Thalassovita autumnalis TaxID=2072972 RepID=A0ABM9UAU3_9RHOB|nr:hypothetical protein TL5118_00511 [Thalassovita autumnalis]